MLISCPSGGPYNRYLFFRIGFFSMGYSRFGCGGEGPVFPYPRGATHFQDRSLTLSAAFAPLSIRLYAGEAPRNILPRARTEVRA
jgi:hypothetical protein